MNFANVKAEMAKGVSFVCASCTHYWRAKDRGANSCGQKCAGPLRKQAFPMYEGPLKGNLVNCCFVCGMQPDAAVDTMGNGLVGVCNKHIDVLENFSVGDERTAFLLHEKVDLVR